MTMDKKEQLELLKNETKAMFWNRLDGSEFVSFEVEDVVREINDAFWEDIFLEVKFADFFEKFRFAINNEACGKEDVVLSRKWKRFVEENIECFGEYSGIEIYDAYKDDGELRYNKMRNLIENEIWEMVYPVLLLQMHDFKQNYEDAVFLSKIKECYSIKAKSLYRASLVLCNKVDKDKRAELETAIKKEIKYIEKIVGMEDTVIENEFEIKLEDMSEAELWCYYAKREADIRQEIDNERKRAGIKFLTEDVLNEDIDEVLKKLNCFQTDITSRLLDREKMSCNAKVFFRILSYSEKSKYDEGIVLKVCNNTTGWLDYYMYRLDHEISWRYDGLALNYYLKSNNLIDVLLLLDWSGEIYEMYERMVREIEKLNIMETKYKQITNLIDDLKEMTPEKWGTTRDVLRFFKWYSENYEN